MVAGREKNFLKKGTQNQKKVQGECSRTDWRLWALARITQRMTFFPSVLPCLWGKR